MTRLKVLFSAYACDPMSGSEAGKGWRVVSHMAAHHDVSVLTRANNRESIEASMRNNPIDGLRFTYYDLPRWVSFWKRGQRGVQVYYYLWQIGAYFRGRKLHRDCSFDLVHHYTFGKYWMPSFLCMLDAPFVWGPVGGGESTPHNFSSHFDLRGRFYEMVRNLARWIGERDPFVRLTARRSAIAYATTADSRERMRLLGARQIEIRPAIALDDHDIAHLGALGAPADDRVRFIFIGRLLGWKGIGLAIEAFARAALPDAELWIAGAGPEDAGLRKLAADRGIGSSVIFWGELPRKEAFAKLGQCHVLVHPSLHDSGGWVCLEAMAARRPVICLDHAGPGALVSNEAGIKVAANSDQQVVADIAEAMKRLAVDRSLRMRMGEAGRELVVTRLAWPSKCAEMSQMYGRLLGRDGPAPASQ